MLCIIFSPLQFFQNIYEFSDVYMSQTKFIIKSPLENFHIILMKHNLNQESWSSVNLEKVIQSLLPHILLKMAFKMTFD